MVSCGAGEYHFSNGDVYLGGWVEEMMEGSGKLTGADGDTYEGESSAILAFRARM